MRSFVKFKPNGQTPEGRKFGESHYQQEVNVWRPFRYTGCVGSFLAFSFSVIAVCNTPWIVAEASDVGVWDTCYVIKPVNHVSKCLATKPHWQNAVIGLMIFAVAFGFLALVLSVFGLCTATLPRKIYYYHSAGEIYFICAFSSTAALIVYPVALATNQETSTDHSYGYGYWLGWGSASFFLLAALCMCLDDLFRTITRGLCCHGGDRSADARV